MPLTPKQQRFVEEYLVDGNAAGAYRRAGYKVKTDIVARVEGHRLLTNPNIVSAIEAGRQKQTERVEITADMIQRGLHKEAQWYGPDGSSSARTAAWRELGKLKGIYPAEGLDLNLAGRLELVEEITHADSDHSTNGQATPGAARLPS